MRKARPCVKASARPLLLCPNFKFFLTELRAVVKCSTVMVTTTVCSRTATSSRTPSFGPEPVITTDCRPVPDQRHPSRSQTSRTRTMAESWLLNFYPLCPLQAGGGGGGGAGPGLKNKSFSLFEICAAGIIVSFLRWKNTDSLLVYYEVSYRCYRSLLQVLLWEKCLWHDRRSCSETCSE